MSDQELIEAVKVAIKENRFVDALGIACKVNDPAVGMRLQEVVLEREAAHLRMTAECIRETSQQHGVRHGIASSSARTRLEKMVAEGTATREVEVRNGTRVVVYAYKPSF